MTPIGLEGSMVRPTKGSCSRLDKHTGTALWQYRFGARARSVPMTYRSRHGVQYLVVAVGREGARLVAFAVESQEQDQEMPR